MLLVRWLVGVIAILITVGMAKALGLPLNWDPAWHVIVFVPMLAVINVVIGPILKLLALPISCLTFGLFSFVINALLFWLAGNVTGGQMNLWSAMFGSIAYGILSTVLTWPIKGRLRS